MSEISNRDDIIDSRDVIARIETLEGFKTERRDALDALEELDEDATEEERERAQWRVDTAENDFGEDEEAELAALRALAKEGENNAGDWQHGASLIRYSYFEEYAQDLAGDIGAIDRNASWPCNCIDWDKAADELKIDYSSIDFDGVEYWVHG